LLGDYAANDARVGVDRRVAHPAAAASGRAASDSA
jgi:hypothetical protein